jgi:hypothetical protein
MPKLRTVYINICVFSPTIDDDDEDIAEEGVVGVAAAGAGEEEVDDADVELHCQVEEQRESVDGLKDKVCGRIVENGHAGLCE